MRRKLSESATRDRVSPSGRRQWKEAEKSRPIPIAELVCVAREDVSSEQQTASNTHLGWCGMKTSLTLRQLTVHTEGADTRHAFRRAAGTSEADNFS